MVKPYPQEYDDAMEFADYIMDTEEKYNLTGPQSRMLQDVWEKGKKVYNGRATKTIRRLAECNLVIYEMELVPHDGPWTERWTVTPSEDHAEQWRLKYKERIINVAN